MLKSAYDGNGQRSLQTVEQTRTNDLGDYRLFWVTPGKYYLRVHYGTNPAFGFNPNQYMGPLDDAYAGTFYPGTADPSAAGVIDLVRKRKGR